MNILFNSALGVVHRTTAMQKYPNDLATANSKVIS